MSQSSNSRNHRRDNVMHNEYDTYDKKTDQIAYKLFGDIFDSNSEFLEDYQDKLKGAHLSEGADLYLARNILYTLITAVIVLVVTGIISVLGLTSGIFGQITGTEVAKIGLAVGFPIFSTIVLSAMIGVLYYIIPSYKSSRRASEIDATLPSAVTFMYALNRGGMNINSVMRMLAENDNVYGEVSKEFGTVIQDMEYFSRDSLSALRRAGERTPSSKFSDLMDDMVSTMDSGAQMSNFLEQKSEDLIVEAEREQSSFIEQLSLLGEVYVTAFVAGPLFMIIITVIMALMGGAQPTQLDGIVYGLLPFMNIGYFFLINVLASSDEAQPRHIEPKKVDVSRSNLNLEEFSKEVDDERIERVYSKKKKRERTSLFMPPYSESITELINYPNKTVIFTAPVALLYLIITPFLGLAEVSLTAFIDAPVPQTMYWLLIPLYIVMFPLMIFYEIGARREKKMMNRFPEALKQIASANSVGMTLTGSLETTANNTTGRLGEELMLVKNDIQWNNNVNESLIKFANRIQVPIVTRTIKLITEANESTGDIEDVLSIASKNVENQVRLRKERTAAMIMYTAVIIISFVVYLFVIAILDMMFLSVIDGMEGADTSDAPGGSSSSNNDGGGQFDLQSLPVDRFRLVFYHSTIVQAFGSGLIAGYLSSNDVRSGLKFALILSLAASVIFFVL